jgi:hypothetical protein
MSVSVSASVSVKFEINLHRKRARTHTRSPGATVEANERVCIVACDAQSVEERDASRIACAYSAQPPPILAI